MLSHLRTGVMGIGAFGYLALACAIALVVPSWFFASLHSAARLAIVGKSEQCIVVEYFPGEAGPDDAPASTHRVEIQGYSKLFNVSRPFKKGEPIVVVSVTNATSVTLMGAIEADSFRFFRLLSAECWGDPRPLVMDYVVLGISLFLVARCLTLVISRAITHGREGLRELAHPDAEGLTRLTSHVLLGGRVLLILAFGLMVFLVVVVAVRAATAVEQRRIVSGLIYFASVLLIGSRAIPTLSQWSADFVQGRVQGKLREMLVSIVSLFAIFELIKALVSLTFKDTSKWEAWWDVLKAFWDALLS